MVRLLKRISLRSRKYGSKTKKYSRKLYNKIAKKSRKMLGYGKSSRRRRRHHRGGSANEVKNIMPEGAALNNFFGNIGINRPATPDETLFGK